MNEETEKNMDKKTEITWSLMHPTMIDSAYMNRIVKESSRYEVDSFERCECLPAGFVPGRKLVIFGMKRLRVYILLWMENGKTVGRNGCYQSVPLSQPKQEQLESTISVQDWR